MSGVSERVRARCPPTLPSLPNLTPTLSYKIAPLGSFSHMEELSGKGSYELYASSDLSPARLLQNRRFNHALVALLDCLRQLVEFGRSSGRAWAAGSIE